MSEILADAGIAHTVCVATEYGEIVMREQTESTKAMQTAGQPIVNLHCGRMDREQMQKFLHDEGYEIVVDATHPYARVVTENLRGAVDTLKSLEKDAHFPIYLRLERKIDGITEADGIVTNVQYFENNADCAKALENTEGNILLTTGSKELAVYCASGRPPACADPSGKRESGTVHGAGNQRPADPGIAGAFFHRDERCHPKAVRHPSYGHEKQRPGRRLPGEAGSSENAGNPGVCD